MAAEDPLASNGEAARSMFPSHRTCNCFEPTEKKHPGCAAPPDWKRKAGLPSELERPGRFPRGRIERNRSLQRPLFSGCIVEGYVQPRRCIREAAFARRKRGRNPRPQAGASGQFRAVVQLEIVGSRGSVIVNGYKARNALGLRDTLYTLTRASSGDGGFASFTFDGAAGGTALGFARQARSEWPGRVAARRRSSRHTIKGSSCVKHIERAWTPD